MKKITAIALGLILALSVSAQAASSIVATLHSISKDQSVMVIKLACTAHTDGAFTDTYPSGKQITQAELFPSGSTLPVPFQLMGYYLYEAWAINPVSGYATLAAPVTMTDEGGAQLIKSGEFALSTSASGVSEATLGKFRALTSLPTVVVGDTGTAANTANIYLKFAR
jgi:hypothetical protein